MKTSAPLSKVQFGLYVECVAHQGQHGENTRRGDGRGGRILQGKRQK